MSIKHIGFDKPTMVPSILFEISCPKCAEILYVRIDVKGLAIAASLGKKGKPTAPVKTPEKMPTFQPRTVA